MRELSVPRTSKWPFFFADAILLALAVFIFWQGKSPLGLPELLTMAGCVALGAAFGIWPFILDYRAAAKLAETEALTSVVAQVQNLEIVAKRISDATGQWQTVNEHADKTSKAAKEIADRMTAETKEFVEFMQKANDAEKATLRLEVDKLRRAEADWLQVLVRMFDHVFALHQGAMRSGNDKVIEQITNFVNACRDVARRIGLNAYGAALDEKFDAQRHQTPEGKVPPDGALVAETLAVGYTFQGRLLRPALVTIQQAGEKSKPEKTSVKSDDQNQLPLDAPDEIATE